MNGRTWFRSWCSSVQITWVVAAATGLLVTTCALVACNSGGNDPVSACNGYCNHVMGCDGLSGSQAATACSNACADAGAASVPCGDGGAALTKLYNCLEGLPCGDFGPDANTTALMNCVTQACQ